MGSIITRYYKIILTGLALLLSRLCAGPARLPAWPLWHFTLIKQDPHGLSVDLFNLKS